MAKDRLVLENGEGLEVELPSKYEVCGRCRGKGAHVNPNIDGHGITADEWNGPDWDEESQEMYLSGGYDISCLDCGGDRVVLVPDEDRLTDEQRKLWADKLECEAAERNERMWEARMLGEDR